MAKPKKSDYDAVRLTITGYLDGDDQLCLTEFLKLDEYGFDSGWLVAEPAGGEKSTTTIVAFANKGDIKSVPGRKELLNQLASWYAEQRGYEPGGRTPDEEWDFKVEIAYLKTHVVVAD